MIDNIVKQIRAMHISKLVIVWLAVMAIYAFWKTIDIARDDWNATTKWEERGQRGDYWGGHIAAGASVVANLLLVITLLLQREELRLQRFELASSRAVAEQQSQTMDMQLRVASDTAEINQIIALGERMHTILAANKLYDKTVREEGGTLYLEQRWGDLRSARQYLGAYNLLNEKVGRLQMNENDKVFLMEFLGLAEDQYYYAAVRTVAANS